MRLYLTFILLFIYCSPVHCQNEEYLDSLKLVIEMHPVDFDIWIGRKHDEYLWSKEFSSDTINQVIIARFNQGLHTSFDALQKAISLNNVEGHYEGNNYKRSMDFIDSILPLIYKNELLSAKLLEKKIYLHNNGKYRNEEDIASNCGYALELLIPLNKEVDLFEAYCHLILGKYLAKKKAEKTRAHKHLWSAQRLSPFWQLGNDDWMDRRMKSNYHRAGTELIRLHWGDLKELENLNFNLFTDGLYYELRTAIEHAGGDWENFWDD